MAIWRPHALPSWLDHFNAADFKLLFRSWVAIWVVSLLMVIQPALRSIGFATFFAALPPFMAPPNAVVLVYLFIALLFLVGMCIGWAWGILALKAAQAARPHAQTRTKFQALQQQAAARAQMTGESVAWETQVLVSNGFMLDARVTVICFVLVCLFIYVLARMRHHNHKLAPLQITGTIIVDLYLVNGPTLPTFKPDFASILVKPGAIGVGISIVCCLFFFPQSMSYVVLDKLETLVRMAEKTLDSTRKSLANVQLTLDQLKVVRAKIIAVWKASEPAVAFLPLNFSRGRWSAEDVKELQAPVGRLMRACLGLVDIHIDHIELTRKRQTLESVQGHDGKTLVDKDGHGVGHRQLLEGASMMDALRSPELGLMRERALQALQDTTADVLRKSSLAIELAARASCVADTPKAIVESHAEMFNEAGHLKADGAPGGPPLLHGIVTTMVIGERILVAAEIIETVLEHVLQLAEARTAHRFWHPFRLRHALSWLLDPVSSRSDAAAQDPDSPPDSVNLEGQTEEVRRHLSAIRGTQGPPARTSVLTRALSIFYRWLTSPGGMYALRMVVATVATAVPAVIPHSAGFFNREKGFWAVITAQTCLLEYMADVTFAILARGLGTVIGGLLGMVAWYIGSGNGPGNPYGMVAIMAVMVAILAWWRIFLPPMFIQATIIGGITFFLVVGFSYDQNHFKQYGLPGLGYEAFWKRVVLVLVGFVASAIVQVLPRPPSAAWHVRRTLANVARALSDHYALLLSHWGRTGDGSPLGEVTDQLWLGVADTLMSLNSSLTLLKIELSFSSFDQKVLSETKVQCQYMNQSLGRLLDMSSSLPDELRGRLVQMAGVLDDRMFGEAMAMLSIIEQSLRTGGPLPERLPAPLLSRFYDWWHAHHHRTFLSTTLLYDENYRRYCVALSSYLRFLSTMDDLVLVLKKALGECHVVHPWTHAHV